MSNFYDIGDVVRCSCEIKDSNEVYIDPTTLVFNIKDPSGNITSYTYGVDVAVIKSAVGRYYLDVTTDEAGQWHYSYQSTTPSAWGEGTFQVGEAYSSGVEMSETSDLDYLLPALRMHIWDISEPSTYSDGTLRRALVTGLKLLMSRWNSRYIPTYNSSSLNWDVARNAADVFKHAAPPTIMYMDERPIVLAAAIALNSGYVYHAAAGTVSWRDEEISFSNIAGSKLQEASLLRDIDELNKLVPDRRKRLATTKRQELPGFRGNINQFEGEDYP